MGDLAYSDYRTPVFIYVSGALLAAARSLLREAAFMTECESETLAFGMPVPSIL
jgi:hypothetical protein